jgi:hypothetical protein|tara:strand:+ start:419 stop:613 length:195 start_codon:yes stop_codon:yes gene_type:complete
MNVYENLCTYDLRNPDNTVLDEYDVRVAPCYCDNCFYGRTELAEKILSMENEIDAFKSQANIID